MASQLLHQVVILEETLGGCAISRTVDTSAVHLVAFPLSVVVTVVIPLVFSMALTSTLLKMTLLNGGYYLNTRLYWQKDKCLFLIFFRASNLLDTRRQLTFTTFLSPASCLHATCQCTCHHCNIGMCLSRLLSHFSISLGKHRHLKNSCYPFRSFNLFPSYQYMFPQEMS